MQSSTQLITFAHKNEAAAFFHYQPFQACGNFHDLYFDGSHYLLITGEGLWDSLTKTLMALSFLEKSQTKIYQVLNLGVAGSLRSGIKKYSTYLVRTSYAALNLQEAEFHSFSSGTCIATNSIFPNLEILDCLSFYKRSTTHQEKIQLAPYASIIDRELWAIAKAANSYQLPWQAIKVISDELEEENSCQLILSQAHEFSKILYDQWSLKTESNHAVTLINTHQHLLNYLQEKSLHLTFSQKHLVTDLVDRILAQEKLELEEFFTQIPLQEWRHERVKENSQSFINWLKIRLTPQLGLNATHISKWLKVWHNSNLNLQLSISQDAEALEVKFKSFHLKDWQEILNHLEKIPRHELDLILSGRG